MIALDSQLYEEDELEDIDLPHPTEEGVTNFKDLKVSC